MTTPFGFNLMGLCPPGCPRSVSMMLHYVTAKNVVSVDLTGMHKAGSQARIVLHVSSSS